MRKWLINKVKHSKLLYRVYYYWGNVLIRLLKLFVSTDNELILFVSFGGKKYDDSPRAIFEQMLKDSRFSRHKFVWAFVTPNAYNVHNAIKVKIDTLKYYLIALKARVWITNSSIERGLSFKNERTFFLNTWHGSAIKKMGSDIAEQNDGFKSKGKSKVDIMSAQGEYDVQIFSNVFSIPSDSFRIIGLPRNDKFSSYTEDYRNEILDILGLDKQKKIILYAPTYREYEFDSNGNYLDSPINVETLRESLGSKYVLLFRAHYAVSKYMAIKNDDFIRDVSNYPKLEDLMIASDILISDYSSIIFDYSIMPKPIICFTYDYDKYKRERGVYFDVRDYFLSASSQKDLIKQLISLDYDNAVIKTEVFRAKFVSSYGNASAECLNIIAKELRL